MGKKKTLKAISPSGDVKNWKFAEKWSADRSGDRTVVSEMNNRAQMQKANRSSNFFEMGKRIGKRIGKVASILSKWIVGLMWGRIFASLAFFSLLVFGTWMWLIPWIQALTPGQQAGYGVYSILVGGTLFGCFVKITWDDFYFDNVLISGGILVGVIILAIPIGIVASNLVSSGGLPVPLAIVLGVIFGPIVMIILAVVLLYVLAHSS